jgi:hypothetical protein
MTQYRCEFQFDTLRLFVDSSEGIAAFKDGFWMTSALEYTKGSDAYYWIPPHAILYITKEDVDGPQRRA